MIKTRRESSTKTVHSAIFDMDGLLIDSEPLWYEAAVEVFEPLGITLNPESYASSIGLRTKEFVANWFSRFQIDMSLASNAEKDINDVVVRKIAENGNALPGVYDVLNQLKDEGINIGLATSSPIRLVDVVVDKLNIRNYFSAFASAEHLVYGKPHPQVFLDCARALDTPPVNCVCFEDSFHGVVAAKAARMFCIAVPAQAFIHQPRFNAADMILNSLEEFNLNILP
jgi:mannitol-1-/sugar-/sorbitol-6-/2-deoxyglucose-6-phosphatase